MDLGNVDEAIRSYREALCFSDGNAELEVGLAKALLLSGNLEEGFRRFQRRRELNRSSRADRRCSWNGWNPQGKTIVVRSEGGYGNVIQFARYLPMLLGAGARVVFECPRELVELLACMEGVELVPQGVGLPCPQVRIPCTSGTL